MFEVNSTIEATCQSWSKPASETEEVKCDNAVRMIKDALRMSNSLDSFEIDFIPKGSYHNNTNVRLNSDVDVAVVLRNPFFADYPSGKGKDEFGHVESDYKFCTYREDVYQALSAKFGYENVELGNKSIKIRSNSHRVDADAVPCLEHRRYDSNGNFITGTAFIPKDNSNIVENYPVQHYENGKNKNVATSKRYKKVVRIIKRIRYSMAQVKDEHTNISSFLIECLIWNVPNNYFGHNLLADDVLACFNYLIDNTAKHEQCKDWGEVSDLLYLFHSGRKYTVYETRKFLIDAKNYMFS
ncbi:nucleotidyltransferase [Oceanobacillus sp. 1P07AA]|uniref:nucleotidyltransferase domain-containing protein n=1 Tax=Oceanobacillus sp. 1P07AA TaxID=3132293 RepID=UPI0039A4910B